MNLENKKIYFSDLIDGKKNNFDFIRFLAASLVIFSHAFPLTGHQDPLEILSKGQSNLGHLSVIVFFVISGYFITQSFHYSSSIIQYIKARLLRIFPGLIGVVILSTFVMGPLVTSYSFKEYITNRETYRYLEAIFLYPMQWNLPGVFENNIYPSSVNGALWSIPFEFMFYILVAVLGVTFLLNKKIATIIFSMLIFIVFIDYWPFSQTHFWGLELKTIFELLLYFVAGMLFFYFKERIPYSGFLAMISIVCIYLSIYTGGLKEVFVFFGTYLIFYIGYGTNLKSWKFYKYGDFSYGIYIYGFPVQQLVTYFHGGEMNPFLNFIISFPIALILAISSWHLIEKRAIDLKKKRLLKVSESWTDLIRRFMYVSNRLVEKFSKRLAVYSWKVFFVFFVVFVFMFTKFNQYPSSIEFPYDNNTIFSGNWLSQSNEENYRWIAKEANVKMEQPPNSSILKIKGYIPDEFEEVQNLGIFINDTLVLEPLIEPGPLDITLDIGKNSSNISKRVTLKLIFNDTHKPAIDAVDQREMSALISLISIE